MMAAVAFPAAALVYDHQNGIIQIPAGHAFNQHFSVMGVANAGAGTRDYAIQLLQMLAFSLSRRNPANMAELDALYFGMQGIGEVAIFQALSVAFNAGFRHGVVTTGESTVDGFSIVRKAQVWAQANLASLRPLLAADFYAMPGMPAGANPPRLRMAYSLLVEPRTGLLRPVVEVLGLAGYVHTSCGCRCGESVARRLDSSALSVD